jgi:hypothetical protein
MQSQQAWIISQHFLSALVQVMQTPSLVFSQWQKPKVRLHWQIWMPLQQAQHEQVPSQSMLQRVCNWAQATSSSQAQWILNPPLHFSNSSLQRGITEKPAAAGAALGP